MLETEKTPLEKVVFVTPTLNTLTFTFLLTLSLHAREGYSSHLVYPSVPLIEAIMEKKRVELRQQLTAQSLNCLEPLPKSCHSLRVVAGL